MSVVNVCVHNVVRYRLRSRCATCPNTAWLLFFGFSIAIVAAVAAAVYLSKKRINMAGLSIGVVRALEPSPPCRHHEHRRPAVSCAPSHPVLHRTVCVCACLP
jgi:hypothetical protein